MLMQTLPAIISGGGGASLAFHALTPDDTTYEMLGVKVGTGDLTTTHTSDLYVQAEDDKYRLHGANEAVWADGYTLRNRLLHSNNMTDTGVWSQPCTVTFDEIGLDGTANTATYMEDDDGAASEQRLQTVTIPDDSLVNVACCYIKKDATTSRFPEFFVRLQGGTQQQIGVQINTSTGASNKRVSTGTTAHEVIDAGDWWLLVVSVQNNSTGNVEALVAIYPAAGATLGNWDESATGSIIVGNVELHLNSTIAKVKLPTDGWIITSTAALSKTWAIDAAGAPLASAPYLQYYPAATNSTRHSNNLSHANWIKSAGATATWDQVGLTGEPNTASELVCPTSAAFINSVTITGLSADTDTHCAVFYLKKNAVDTAIQVNWRMHGGTVQNYWEDVDLNLGTCTSVDVNSEVIDLGDWWKVIIEGANNGTNTQFTPKLGLEAGNFIVGNVEGHTSATTAAVRGLGPIFTTSASVSTDEALQEADDANHDDTEGAWYAEIEPSFASSEVTGDLELLSLNTSADLLYYDGTNSQVESADGTNTGVKSLTTVASTAYQIAVAFGSGNMRVNVDGTWGTEASYDGTYTAGTALDIMRAMGYSCKMRNLRFYSGTYATAQTAIDGLMP